MVEVPPTTLFHSSIPGLTKLHSGKVRDLYEVDEHTMLIVTTDRLSAFDAVLPDPIPGKGHVLNQISEFWFGKVRPIVPNHLTGRPLSSVISDAAVRAPLEGRSVIVRRLSALPLEAVVRGYLIGSGWKDYQRNGEVCGVALPKGLKLAQELPEPIFTPATKAAPGQHDENISFGQLEAVIGRELAAKVRDRALDIYRFARAHAQQRGIIIADTKLEFALDEDGVLTLIDEVLTPDSSRFWPADRHLVGESPPSFDKQPVRDYLERIQWNKAPPAPHLPADVIARTSQSYREVAARLMA
jgi:phosphoribosylaminoimidazole-succinocarboxamide synthase